MLNADLRVMSGRHEGKIISLTTKKFLVGRGEDCHMRPNNDLVSRHHCIFNLDEYSVRLRDLGSTNGTIVNGEKIRGQVELKTGDHVRIGKLDLQVTIKQGAPLEPAAIVEEPIEPMQLTGETIPAYEESAAESYHESVTETLNDTSMFAQGDTQYFPPQQSPPPPLQFAPNVYPSGYGFPPQVYPPQGYPQAYPPPAYGVPGYPQPMPPGPFGGYPYPQQGYPPQPMPGPVGYPPGYPQPTQGYPMPAGEEIPDVEEPEVKRSAIKEVQIKLPDPSETGVKEAAPVEKKPEQPSAQPQQNPASLAGDIIKQYVQRRPGS